MRNDLPTLLEKGYGLGLSGAVRACVIGGTLTAIHEIHMTVACPLPF